MTLCLGPLTEGELTRNFFGGGILFWVFIVGDFYYQAAYNLLDGG